MDDGDRQKAENELYTKNLEKLVKARTDQLTEVVTQNEELLALLNQVQSMESLEQVKQAAQSWIKKFTPEPTPAPKFFGREAGERVPEVDPDDLKAIWQLGQEGEGNHRENQGAISKELMERACKPGANVEATFFRSGLIWMLSQFAHEQLAPWMREGQVADSVFRTMASFPMQWVQPGVPQDVPFDGEEFFRRLGER